MITSYRDLIVWQKSMDLVTAIYELTANFPESERFGLVTQIRRCSVSIPSNIAEGSKRGSKKDYRQFLIVAYGSGAELETQIEIAKRLSLGKVTSYENVEELINEVMRMLNRMISSLKPTT